MGHSNVWNSHPKSYGPGSRACFVKVLTNSFGKIKERKNLIGSGTLITYWVLTVCVGTLMELSGSTGSCAADSASAAMPRRLVSLSTVKELKDCLAQRRGDSVLSSMILMVLYAAMIIQVAVSIY
ncbi:hypothetical protein JRO89_XS02G0095700 [Xanthoceras sorbifolium]|uniref:Uncharacterized protein n=1 Tax=Xanthoceras sorbifolium TaxID=99658 RepID=A0ABQ8IFF2_9ROSI|nr:hypothetical protein JRO89_XS02G0095700 [Xanthoceras sorbifolium]